MAAFGAVFARRLQDALTSVSPSVHIAASGGQLNPATVKAQPPAIRRDVFYAIAHAIQGVFIWAIPACALAFALTWFLKEVPLRGRVQADEPAAPELVG